MTLTCAGQPWPWAWGCTRLFHCLEENKITHISYNIFCQTTCKQLWKMENLVFNVKYATIVCIPDQFFFLFYNKENKLSITTECEKYNLQMHYRHSWESFTNLTQIIAHSLFQFVLNYLDALFFLRLSLNLRKYFILFVSTKILSAMLLNKQPPATKNGLLKHHVTSIIQCYFLLWWTISTH